MCVCVCVSPHDSVTPVFHKLHVLYSDGNWRVKCKSWTIKCFHNFLSTVRKVPQLKNGMRGHSAVELPPLYCRAETRIPSGYRMRVPSKL